MMMINQKVCVHAGTITSYNHFIYSRSYMYKEVEGLWRRRRLLMDLLKMMIALLKKQVESEHISTTNNTKYTRNTIVVHVYITCQ